MALAGLGRSSSSHSSGRVQGIVRPPLTTALALMAVVTMLMASPLFLAADRRAD